MLGRFLYVFASAITLALAPALAPSSATAATPRPDSLLVFMSGSELKDLCMTFKEALDNNWGFEASEVREKEGQVGILMGYVSGIHDANAESFASSTPLSREQLMAVVSKHVLDHPEGWHLSGRELVSRALRHFYRTKPVSSGGTKR